MPSYDAMDSHCAVCEARADSFHHLTDIRMIAVASALGFEAEDNFCDLCYHTIQTRSMQIGRTRSSVEKTPTIETMDVELPTTQDRSADKTVPRLSEMPLPISPPRSSGSESTESPRPAINILPKLRRTLLPIRKSTSDRLDDTVDRMVNKPSRVAKEVVSGIASQSLSLENTSSQDMGLRRDESDRKSPSITVSSDESSASIQVPPMPKNRRVRPTAKQFATGRLDLPLSVQTKILPGDMPRAISG